MNEPRTDAVFHDYRSTPYVWHSRAINFNKLRLIGTRCPVHGGSQLNPTSTMPYRQLSNSPFESATNGANSYLMGYGGYPIYTDNHPHLHHHHHHPHHHHAQYLSPPLPLHHHYHPYYSSPIYIPGSPPGPYSHPIPMPYHSLYSYGKPLPPPPKISNQYRRMSHNAFEHGNNQPIRSNRTSPQTQPYTDEKIYRNKCRGHLIVLAIIMTVITIGVIMGIILAVTIN
ncbi:hypothetical protein BLOT_015330 [Blomia tropicalis]|nr:hypothetical protein BLOT_015330 [Blomia tropicalis]